MPALRKLPSHLPPNSTAIVRVDFNVPLGIEGEILDTARICNHEEIIQYLQAAHCRIVLLAHLGKPDGQYHPELSFSPLVDQFSQLLGTKIQLQTLENYHPIDQVTLIENIRFYPGEEANNAQFSQQLAKLGALYINDAFSVSHRAHASTVGITRYLPSYAGTALAREYEHLDGVLHNPASPVTLIIGGKKISDKIGVLEHLLPKVDHVLMGGACANVFAHAQGEDIGQSYSEDSMLAECKTLLSGYSKQILLPVDYQVKEQMRLDLGPKTLAAYQGVLQSSKTIIWAGPMGKYEEKPFDQGSIGLLKIIVASNAESIIGGGDTIAALQNQPELAQVSFVSLGGGAMLNFLAQESLPGTDCLLTP